MFSGLAAARKTYLRASMVYHIWENASQKGLLAFNRICTWAGIDDRFPRQWENFLIAHCQKGSYHGWRSAVNPVSSVAVSWPGVQFSSQNSLAGSFLVFNKHYWCMVENVLLWLPAEPFLLFTDLITGNLLFLIKLSHHYRQKKRGDYFNATLIGGSGQMWPWVQCLHCFLVHFLAY